MGRECRTHGRYENSTKHLVENLKGRNYLRDLDVDERIILKNKEIGCDYVDSIHLAQDKDQWRSLVKTNDSSDNIKERNFLTS